MDIHVRDRMFYRQAKNTVLVAFALGIVLSCIQIGYDVLRERRQIDVTVSAMMGMVKDSAVHAAYDLNNDLALQVVNGLMEYAPIYEASIVDELGLTLASNRRPLAEGTLPDVASVIFGAERAFTVPLIFPVNDRLLGHLHVSVDSYVFAVDFFSRSGLVLLSEFVRNVALATLFLYIFYVAVTRPLFQMIARLSAIDIEKPAEELLTYAPGHDQDELGLLVDSINMLLSRLGESLIEYQYTQKELERHRDHLEDVVEKRTQKLRELVEELQQAKEAADAASHAKSMFLASMSHEFRTPLNAVLGFTQLLLNTTSITPQQHEYLSIINRSGEHLLTLINQVLDLSKMESGKMDLHEQEFNVALLLNSLVEVFRMRAKEKNLQLRFQCDSDVPLYIRTDEVKLRQVLISMLSNAVKFTRAGIVTLRVRRVKTPDGSPPHPQNTLSILFDIEDTGIGISPDAVDQIFEAFAQTSSGSLPQEGTGLGLAISRKFVRLMGGDIYVNSTPGRGTIFTFDICVPVVERVGREALTFPGTPVVTDPDTPRYKILVVDDIWDNRQLLALLMKQFNFEVQEADAGTNAFELWKSWRPHLIWLDIRMPGNMDGYAVAKNIRAIEMREAETPPGNTEKDVPDYTKIIAVTAGVAEEDHAPGLQAGCDDVLSKPYKTAEVFALIEKHLDVHAEYPSSPPADVEYDALTPETLAILPDTLREELQHAIEAIDLQAMQKLLEQVREYNADLAERLNTLTRNYRFDTLQQLVKNTDDD